jgi:hypothetical protein
MCEWIIAKSPNKRILTSSALSSVNGLGAAIISRNCFLLRSKQSGKEGHEVLGQYSLVTLHIAILIRRQIVGVELR